MSMESLTSDGRLSNLSSNLLIIRLTSNPFNCKWSIEANFIAQSRRKLERKVYIRPTFFPVKSQLEAILSNYGSDIGTSYLCYLKLR